MTEGADKDFVVFPWDKNLETGIPLIDQQHQKLVDLLNQLALHLVRGEKVELEQVFDELAAYADFHFKAEEKIWGPCFLEDEWLIDHKQAHSSFLPKVKKIREEGEGKPFYTVIEETIKFLIHWLTYHILDNDKRMAIVLDGVNSGETLEYAQEKSTLIMSETMGLMVENILTMYDKLASKTLNLMKETEERKRIEKKLTQANDELEITKEKLKRSLESAQDKMLVSEKLATVGELAAGVSHEVLNPVNIISVHTQMLQRKTKNDSNIQNFCNKVRREIERIQKIMSSLLAFSRKGNAQVEKGYLTEEIDKTLTLVEEEYKLSNIKIVRNWCENNTAILYDADKMRQVYLNLLHNAHHAMPDGGTITVGCKSVKEADKKFYQFTFSDTGTGMSKKVQLKIFEPFFTTKPKGQGTGMGLAVIHGIIEEHGGKIRVESEEGKGTTFIISLPASD